MIIHKDLVQGTDEWLQIKLGKLTASHAQAIASNGKGLDTLCFKKVDELVSGEIEHGYKNADMERGNELEAVARFEYEMQTDNIVEKVGFIELDKYTGCSPDGLVGEDGGIEIKCPNIRIFYEYQQSGKVDTGYMWQIQMNLYVSDRKWWDYVVYNPNFKESLIVKRIERDEEKIEKIKIGLEAGIKKIEEIMEGINNVR